MQSFGSADVDLSGFLENSFVILSLKSLVVLLGEFVVSDPIYSSVKLVCHPV